MRVHDARARGEGGFSSEASTHIIVPRHSAVLRLTSNQGYSSGDLLCDKLLNMYKFDRQLRYDVRK